MKFNPWLPHPHRHPKLPAKNGIVNKAGLTPLTLACKLGRSEVFREMLELSCREFWRYSNITCSAYPLNALDTLMPDGSTSKLMMKKKKKYWKLITKGERDVIKSSGWDGTLWAGEKCSHSTFALRYLSCLCCSQVMENNENIENIAVFREKKILKLFDLLKHNRDKFKMTIILLKSQTMFKSNFSFWKVVNQLSCIYQHNFD